MDARDRLPKRLRNASPERIQAYRRETMRKAKQSEEECRVLFRQRMEREGRLQELNDRINEYRHLGKSRRQATSAVMREMGYAGPTKERQLHEEAKGRAIIHRNIENQKRYAKKRLRKMRNKELFDAMDRLKANAPAEVEMDWVAAHYKYLAAIDQIADEQADPVKVTAEDVTDAPSRSAVGRLMVAVTDPLGWQKKRLDADKGKTSAGQGGENDQSDAQDESLDDIEKMLKAASG